MHNKFINYSGSDILKIDIMNNISQETSMLPHETKIEQFDIIFKDFLENTDLDYSDINSRKSAIRNYLGDITNIKEPELVFMGLDAYLDYIIQEPNGYLVSFDASSSGIQIMSAITKDIVGMKLTNLLNSQIKYDLYTFIYKKVAKFYKDNFDIELNISRKDIKQVIMIMMYGGYYSILSYLNQDKKLYKIVEQHCKEYLVGAYTLKEILLKTVNNKFTEYTWKLPDGFTVNIPILVKYEETRNLPNSHEITVKYFDKGGVDNYKGNAANVIHSIDAFIAREVVRRCNYNANKVFEVIKYIHSYLDDITESNCYEETNKELENIINSYLNTKCLSIRIIEYIHKFEDIQYLAEKLGTSYIQKLLKLLQQITNNYSSFEIVVIHDCYKCLPNNMNIVRYWYNNILADIAESNTLGSILSSLPLGENMYDKYFNNLDDISIPYVREANYSIS